MPIYTITSGAAAKLLATERDITRTVTTLTGLTPTDAADLAGSLSQVTNDLTVGTADPHAFAAQATVLGLRTAQVFDGDRLTVSLIADQPTPATPVTYGPRTYRVHHLARVLQVADLLPDPSARAVRGELRNLLEVFDGPVAVAEVNQVTGPPVSVNLATWLADPDSSQDVNDLLIGSWPDSGQAAEQVAWFHSAPGRVLERTAHELVAAEWDIDVYLDLAAIVKRLAVTDPALLASVVAVDDECPDVPLDGDQAAALALARTLLDTRP